MRDILITGGAGKIGLNLVQKLLDTNYSITILELESKESIKRLEKFKNKVKIVYGDVEDANLVRDLIKRNDIVVDYAGVMPPLANLNENIAHATNYKGTKNIVDAIKDTNPECIYIYMSFLSVYGLSKNVTRKLSLNVESTYPDDFYSVSLIRSEDYITNNLEKYVILRMPIVLTRKNYYIKHMKLNRKMDFITKEDLNDIVIDIMKKTDVLGKVFDVSGFKANSTEVVETIYKNSGKLSLLGRNLYYGEFVDSDEIDKIAHVKYTTLEEFGEDLNRETNGLSRIVRTAVHYPIYMIFKKMTKKR